MTYTISDIAFASFLVMNGKSISSISRKGRKVFWVFQIPENEMLDLEAKWPSSEAARFYNTYQTLKTHIKVPKNNAN